MQRSFLIAALVLLPAWSVPSIAQQLSPPAAVEPSPDLNIAGAVGDQKFQSTGPGTCRHAPEASLNDVSASMWMVEFRGKDDAGLRRLNLTLWRFKDGIPDKVTLALETKSGSHRIDTSDPDDARGEASVTILPSGPGGRLEVNGKKRGGKPVQITIDCPTFTDVQAEGG
jgi:hypothetical protein